MTAVRVSLVDVYVLRPASGRSVEVLTLKRAAGGRNAGSWETVHGHIEAGETPVHAAVRELREETGLMPDRLTNASRVDAFYRHGLDEVSLIPVFAATVAPGAQLRLGPEHDAAAWLSCEDACARLAWPRERRALPDVLHLAGPGGDIVRDVLDIDPRLWTGAAS